MMRTAETLADAVFKLEEEHPGERISFALFRFCSMVSGEQRKALLCCVGAADEQAAWGRIVELAAQWARLVQGAWHGPKERQHRIRHFEKIVAPLRKAHNLIREAQQDEEYRELEGLLDEWEADCRLLVESVDTAVNSPVADWQGRNKLPYSVINGLADLFEDTPGRKATRGDRGQFFGFAKAFFETLGLSVIVRGEGDDDEEDDPYAIGHEALLTAIKRALRQREISSLKLGDR
jgi:hypothetical protein